MTHSSSPVASPLTSASTADLVKLATSQVSNLVRDEIELAKMELQAKARHAGAGAGMFAAAGVLSGYGLGALLVCLGLLLALVLPGWAAALIVAGAIFLVAAMLVLIGRSQLKQAGPPVPAGAVAGVKADVAAVSDALRHRGIRPGAERWTDDGATG
ncbi:MAG TPA: phage holin family protein [Micromonosporaceae bacterium]